jgi:hypothetical protein
VIVRRHLLASLALLLASVPAFGQSRRPPLEPASVDVSVSADTWDDLPGANTLPALLGVLMPELVPDRIDTGGLGTGEAARLGVHASSWTQTQYRLGDVDITDPDGSGTPLFVPGMLEWQRVDIGTGLQPVDVNAPGLVIRLVPRDPGAHWTRRVEGSAGPSAFTAGRSLHAPPAIQRASTWGRASAMASGPLIPERLGLVAAGSWMRTSRFDRADPTLVAAEQESLFAHLVFTPSATHTLRTIVHGQHVDYPLPARVTLQQPLAAVRETSGFVQSTWERRTTESLWRVFGGYSLRDRESTADFSAPIRIERLRDGPVLELFYPAPGATPPGLTRRWTVGSRATLEPFTRLGRIHTAAVGLEAVGARAEVGEPLNTRVGELVNGIPARVWDYSGWRRQSEWSSSRIAAYLSDAFELWRNVRVDAGVRFERITGEAAGAAQNIAWGDWYPRVAVRWEPTGSPRLAVVSGYGRYGYALPLRWLAAGDPAAPAGTVSRWLAASASGSPRAGEVGPLIARVGPGSGSAMPLVAIDPDLERPHFDELVVGVESRRGASTTIRLTGFARWEHDWVGLTNPGVSEAAYSVVTRFDSGTGEIEQMLPAYNRSPASFGADRYVLTNPGGDAATFVGLDLIVQTRTKHLFFWGGATAGQIKTYSANRGFLSVENDPGLLGEVFSNPNARTFAPGRPFSDRGFTLKMSGTYQFPRDLRLGVIARYQDGQAFSRLVVFEGLNQGPEAVRAFENGGTRFTFTMTIDARLQKGFRIGERQVDLLLDAYNLSNRLAEVDESQADGPTWRTPTAVQPPMAIHAGIRVRF